MSCNLKKLVNVIFHTTLAARDRQNTNGKPLRKVRRRPRFQSEPARAIGPDGHNSPLI
jgi:hypothetical protein